MASTVMLADLTMLVLTEVTSSSCRVRWSTACPVMIFSPTGREEDEEDQEVSNQGEGVQTDEAVADVGDHAHRQAEGEQVDEGGGHGGEALHPNQPGLFLLIKVRLLDFRALGRTFILLFFLFKCFRFGWPKAEEKVQRVGSVVQRPQKGNVVDEEECLVEGVAEESRTAAGAGAEGAVGKGGQSPAKSDSGGGGGSCVVSPTDWLAGIITKTKH
ncbi:hypothetical protein TYRP_015454 [Tyrophagus putrescentiae]|nr:hypothetical protein TYRP_015454 [Tyrophagus putrescentiae]